LKRVHQVFRQTDELRRTFKYLVTHYEQLSREQARYKAKIKARLRTLGIIRKDARLFRAAGQTALLDEIESIAVKRMFTQSFAVLNQMLESLAIQSRCFALTSNGRMKAVPLFGFTRLVL